MSELLRVWDNKRKHLANDYINPTSNRLEDCYCVAEDIANALLDDGQKSKIFKIMGENPAVSYWPRNQNLVPKVYEGRVSWGAHFVCISAGLVYDPILSAPEPLDTYAAMAFGIPIELTFEKEFSEIPKNLPEFDGNLTAWQADVAAITNTLRDGSCEYMAQLPQVVGYVPENERSAFCDLNIEENSTPGFMIGTFHMRDESPQRDYLENALPGTLQIIRDDIALISSGERELDGIDIYLDLAARSVDWPQPPELKLHNDIAIRSERQADEVFYVVVNVDTTEFYEGPARLFISAEQREKDMVALDTESLDERALHKLVKAPRFAIVRLSYATIHKGQSNVGDDKVLLKALSTRF